MRLLVFLALFTTCEIAFSQDPGSYKCITINPQDFYNNAKLNPEIKVSDVRMKSEFRPERIENAINIPLSKLPCKKAEAISRETTIYLYCKSGTRSCWAAAKFNDMGFKHIYSLEGGITAWKKSGLPVTGIKGNR
jgi:rhodanese-related sulfurtransferase